MDKSHSFFCGFALLQRHIEINPVKLLGFQDAIPQGSSICFAPNVGADQAIHICSFIWTKGIQIPLDLGRGQFFFHRSNTCFLCFISQEGILRPAGHGDDFFL